MQKKWLLLPTNIPRGGFLPSQPHPPTIEFVVPQNKFTDKPTSMNGLPILREDFRRMGITLKDDNVNTYLSSTKVERNGWIMDAIDRPLGRDLADKILDVQTGELLTLEETIHQLKQKKVIYFGEFHNHRSHHQGQLLLLKSLMKQGSQPTLAMEFLYRADQPLIDRFINDASLTEKEMAALTRGFAGLYPEYQPILTFARQSKIKTIGINVETELKHKRLELGWDALSPTEKKLIANDLHLDNLTYSNGVRSFFLKMGVQWSEEKMQRMIALQAIWDATFAERVAEHTAHPHPFQGPLVVILGADHAKSHFSTPQRAYHIHQASYGTIVPVAVGNDERVDLKEMRKSATGDFLFLSLV